MTASNLPKAYNLEPAFSAILVESGQFGGARLLRESAAGRAAEAERYFNDLYHLFLGKFAQLSSTPEFSEEEAVKMRSLLDELLRAKQRLAAHE